MKVGSIILWKAQAKVHGNSKALGIYLGEALWKGWARVYLLSYCKIEAIPQDNIEVIA